MAAPVKFVLHQTALTSASPKAWQDVHMTSLGSHMLVLAAADESDEEEEAGQQQQAAASPVSRISTSMVNQATAHLQKNGRSAHKFLRFKGLSPCIHPKACKLGNCTSREELQVWTQTLVTSNVNTDFTDCPMQLPEAVLVCQFDQGSDHLQKKNGKFEHSHQ